MAQTETENFRKNLATLCEDYGSVQKIASGAGVHRVHVSRIIHGRVVPSLDVASKIAEASGVPLNAMLGSPEKFSPVLAKAS